MTQRLLWVLLASAAYAQTATTFPGTTAVGSTADPVIVTLTAQTTGTISSLAALTSGSPSLDFAATPVTCAVGLPLITGESCTVSVVFSPQYPGVRQGAVLAMAGSTLLASAPLSGIALGSLPVLLPGTINTVAGDGDWIYQRDGIPATNAPIFLPSGLAVDAAGDLYLCDTSNNRIRRVDATTGNISTVAGNGSPGGAGDGGLATSAELNNPSGLAIDGAGNLYIADTGNNVVRRVDAVSGVITTFAGQIGTAGYSGDGGAATNALLVSPRGLALMPAGDLVITDSGNNAVRLVSITSNQIQTVAGTGVAGYNGDGIAAKTAELNDPYGVAARTDGAIAIADLENQRVRLVSPLGVISTVLGTGQRNAGSPTQQQLDGPADVAFDPAGDLFVADAGNNRIRIVLASDGSIQTITGTTSEQFAGDGGPANQASLYGPYSLVFDEHGTIWISDTFHNRVREITGSLLDLTYATMKVGNVSAPMLESLSNDGNADLVLGNPVLTQAALDASTTTCSQAAMPPAISCNMGIEFAPSAVGSNITGSIQWPSNAPNVTPIDSLSGNVLSVNVTSVKISSSVNPAALGSAVTFTATVTSQNTSRTGTVTFTEGSTTWCPSVALGANGTAACVISGLSLGTHVLNGSYSGDANDAPSSSAGYTEVIKQQPALVLSAAPDPAVAGSTVTMTLNAVDTTGAPTGTVVFYDGGISLGSSLLNSSGIAQWTTSTLITGAHSLSAQYGGDSANLSGTSNTVSEAINQAGTTTTLASSAGNATVGWPLTFTATVANSNGPAITGSVTFRDGGSVLGTHTVTAGAAAITVSTLIPGSHSITASYSGDSNNIASGSAALVESIQQIATVTAFSSNVSVLNAGGTAQLTANAAIAPGTTADGALTGSVTFKDGATALGTVAINASGLATMAVSGLSAGSHTLTAAFSGNANYAASNAAPLSLSVQQTATQSLLSAAYAVTLAGTPATWSVLVTSTTGIPTGQVVFRDGTAVVATATLSATGTATVSSSALARGTHAMTAVYSGDGNYLPSTSLVLDQVVQLALPSVALSGPAAPVEAGLNAYFVATLSTPGITPTGTLSLMDGGPVIATDAVTGNGAFSFSTAAFAVGSHTITAGYSGDTDNNPAASLALTLVIRQASSTVSLAASANPLTQGSNLALTAAVTSDSPGLGGRITFLDGATLLGSATLGSQGAASLETAQLSAGTHALTAVYVGDANHAASTSPVLTEVVLETSSARLTSSNNPSPSGQTITFTAVISGGGKTVPGGNISLADNGALLATLALDKNGSAIFATSTLGVGQHTITLGYTGDANYSGNSAQLVQTVIDATTSTTLAGPASPATFGQAMSLTATVASNGAPATGTVTFTDAGASIGTAPLTGTGTAILALSTLGPGPHTMVAVYGGSPRAAASSSAPLLFSIRQSTQLALTSNGNPAWTLSPIAITATVTNAGASPLTGSVSFTLAGAVIGNSALDATGHATISLPAENASVYTLAASYSGDGENFSSASTPYAETVQLRTTTTAVTGSAGDPSNPQQITLIAVVGSQGPVPPSGMVTFSSGKTTLGQASVGSTGVALLTAAFTQSTEQITVSYSGDLNYAASQSTAAINAGTITSSPQFVLAVSAPSVTIVTSEHTTIQVTIASVTGFSDTIALGCLGLPHAGTCTFSPSQVVLSANGTATAALIVDTGNPLGAGPGTNASLAQGRSTFLCWLPIGLLAGLLRRRRNFLLFSVLLFVVAGLLGCNGLSTADTVPGSYTIKVVGTGQSTGVSETQTLKLVVTQ